MNNRVINLTDAKGKPMVPEDQRYEPLPGSVVLTQGLHGTAWQRHFFDGMWHSTIGSRPRTWAQLLRNRNVVLIYDAEERQGTPVKITAGA